MQPKLTPDLKAVVFDAYGTLARITERRSPFKKLLHYAQQQGRCSLQDDAASVMACPGGLLEVADRLGIHLPGTVYRELAADLAAELGSVVLFDDVNATLNLLKSQGLKIGLCSNLAEPYAAPLLQQLSVQIDCYAWSYLVGAIKPSPAIYGYVLDHLDCLPGQVLFVGDTPDADIDGPQQIGMQARLIRRDRGESLMDVLGIALR